MYDTGNDDADSRGFFEGKRIPQEFVEYSDMDHGVSFGTGFVCEPWFDRAVAFWVKQREKG